MAPWRWSPRSGSSSTSPRPRLIAQCRPAQSQRRRGASWHIVTDLVAFVATLVAGFVICLTGWTQADAVATLVVAALMAVAAYRLLRDSARIFLEASPRGIEPGAVEEGIRGVDGVTDVHELHVWEVTSGFPALSAHVLVDSRPTATSGGSRSRSCWTSGSPSTTPRCRSTTATDFLPTSALGPAHPPGAGRSDPTWCSRAPRGSAAEPARLGFTARAATSSAICTVLRAAPLRRLSLLTKSTRPRSSGTPGSCRSRRRTTGRGRRPGAASGSR